MKSERVLRFLCARILPSHDAKEKVKVLIETVGRRLFGLGGLIVLAEGLSAPVSAQSVHLPPLDPATLPATESEIPPPINWPSPPLGEGPFLIESAVPAPRELRVVVVARGLGCAGISRSNAKIHNTEPR